MSLIQHPNNKNLITINSDSKKSAKSLFSKKGKYNNTDAEQKSGPKQPSYEGKENKKFSPPVKASQANRRNLPNINWLDKPKIVKEKKYTRQELHDMKHHLKPQAGFDFFNKEEKTAEGEKEESTISWLGGLARYIAEDTYNECCDLVETINEVSTENNWNITRFVESTFMFLHGLIRSRDKSDALLAFCNYYLICNPGKSVLRDGPSDLFSTMYDAYLSKDCGFGEWYPGCNDKEPEPQSVNFDYNDMRRYLNQYNYIRSSPAFEKLYKLFLYALSTTLCESIGITFSACGFNTFQEEAIRKTLGKESEADIVYTVLDTLTFFCERGHQCLITGKLDPIFHSGNGYEQWFEEYNTLQREALLSDNFEEHGIHESDFLARLDKSIEQGEAMYKYAVKMRGREKEVVSNALNKLKILQSQQLTVAAAAKTRDPPFALLIFGNSSIGKTGIMEMLHVHFAARKGLNPGPEFRYVRNPAANFWDNFRTQHWSLVLDDISYQRADKVQGIDPTVDEIIRIINSASFVPDQADLAKKGKTPMRVKFVCGTSNVKTMNVEKYFSCPSAVQRRMKYIVTATLRPEFDDQGRLDQNAARAFYAEHAGPRYPDFYIYTVEMALPKPIVGVNVATAEPLAELKLLLKNADLKTFLDWFNDAIDEHYDNLKTSRDAMKMMYDVTLCNFCHTPTYMCESTCDRLALERIESTNLNRQSSDEDEDESLRHFVSEMMCDVTLCNYCYTPTYMCTCTSTNFIQQSSGEEGEYYEPFRHFPWKSDDHYNKVFAEFEQYCDFPATAFPIDKPLCEICWTRDFNNTRGWCKNCWDKSNLSHCKKCKNLFWWDSWLSKKYFEKGCVDCDSNEDLLQIIGFSGNSLKKVFPNYFLFPKRREREIYALRPQSMNNTFEVYAIAYLILGALAYAFIPFKKVLVAMFRHCGIVKFYNKLNNCLDRVNMASATIEELSNDVNYWKNMGKKAQKTITSPRTIKFIVAFGGMYASFRLGKLAFKWFTQKEPQSEVKYDNGGVKPSPTDVERVNVWKQDSLKLSPLDVTAKTKSWKALDLDKITELLFNNCVHLDFHMPEGKRRSTKAINVCSQVYVMNAHAVPEMTSFDVDLIFSPRTEGINSNLTVTWNRNDIFFFPDTDLAFVIIRAYPPGRDITDLFIEDTFDSQNHGFLLSRGPDGEKQINNISKMIRKKNLESTELKTVIDSISGTPQSPTLNGDCGSMLVGKTALGPVILGIHYLGGRKNMWSEYEAVAIRLTRTMVNQVVNRISPRIHPGEPMLSSENYCREITTLHPKSTTRYIEKGTARIYGTFTGHRSNHKSSVRNSIMNAYLSNYGYETKFTAPEMRSWKPWNIAISQMVDPVTRFDPHILSVCANSFYQDIVRDLPKYELRLLQKYDYLTSINGRAGVSYVDAINRHTSAGEPFNKSKMYFMEKIEPYDDNPDPVIFNDEVMQRVVEMDSKLQQGIRVCPVFTNHLKDEAVSFKKAQIGKTRIFSGAPLDYTIVMRTYFLSAIRVIQRNRFAFECAVGVNAHSAEWAELYNHMTHFGVDNNIAGDYAKYDKTMCAHAMLEAFNILIQLNTSSGSFTREDILAMHTIASDITFAYSNFNGDLIQFFGGNPSGHSLTVIINCLVNSLYMRYAYVSLHPSKNIDSVATFRENVRMIDYGDDNWLNVSGDIPWYNHTTVSQAFASIGITYTMADKEAESVPYIHISEVTFLKRGFRTDEDVECVVGPLDEESIEKMLMVWVRSKTITPEEQAVAIISSAVREYFFHGKEKFDTKVEILKNMVSELNLESYCSNSTFPTWEDLFYAFWDSSKHVQKINIPQRVALRVVGDDSNINQNTTSSDSYCTAEIEPPQQDGSEHGSDDEIHQGDPQSISLNKIVSLVDTYKVGEQFSYCPRSGEESYNRSTKISNLNKVYSPIFKNGDERGVDSPYLRAQSEGVDGNITSESKPASNSLNTGTVEYMDENPGEILNYNPIRDSSFYNDYIAAGDISDFFSRPVLIGTYNWAENSSFTQTLEPWYLFFNDSYISKKLSNYAFVSCNLHIKIMINASPFYYGMLLANYTPNTGLYQPSTASIATYSGKTGWMTPFSQKPHISIYPQCNKGGEMVLPFVYHKNWLRTASAADFQNMGTLQIQSYIPLNNANSVSSGNVTIQVYAWASDIRLTGATSNLLLQAKDEYSHSGPISGPASAIAEGMGMLSKIPVIGPYMTASSMVASGIGDLAAHFGFTNVPVVSDTMPVKNCPFGNFSSPDISMPVEKLTIDPKNELTIDPRVTGLSPVDELDINTFCARESWIYSGAWNSTDAVDTIIFQSLVLPDLANVDTSSTAPSIRQSTPMGLANRMFSYWRGDIIFRFRIIATKFHRGRLRLTWDPEGDLTTNNTTSTVAFTRIIDISSECDFEVNIPYQQALPWLRTGVYQSWSKVNFGGPGSFSYSNRSPTYDNGILTLKIFTTQTSPVASAPISIVVSVKGASNLEFACPAELDKGISCLPPQSQTEECDYDNPAWIEAGAKSTVDPHRFLISMGESVKNFRSLLRRSCFLQSLVPTVNSGNMNINTWNIPRVPAWPGYDPNGGTSAPGVITTTTNYPCNLVFNTAYHYLADCFLGQRGSFIYHFNTDSPQEISTVMVMRTKRNLTAGQNMVTGYSAYVPTGASAGFQNGKLRNSIDGGGAGMALSNQFTQTGLSVLAPLYNPRRYISTAPTNSTNSTSAGPNADDTQDDTLTVVLITKPSFFASGSLERSINTNVYMGVGTDFSLIWFICVPSMWIYQCSVPSS
jgi:hypothetical protein